MNAKEKKKSAYIKVGKLKLHQEEWEAQTSFLDDFFKPGKIVAELKEMKKPAEEEIKLIPAKKEKEPNETGEIKLIEIPKNQTNDEGGGENEKNN